MGAPSDTITANKSIPRIHSVDILRGLVMVIMALDHVRDYVYPVLFDPTDVTQTTPALFATRWITHFCAPVFVFLAGTSAYLWYANGRTRQELSKLLFTRGLWLMFVEIVIINFLWNFNFDISNYFVQVIWVIGLSMVVLAGLIYLPWKALLVFCLATVFLHNTLDGIAFPGEGLIPWAWTILHNDGPVFVNEKYFTYVVYPLIPWFAVMGLGFCFGRLFHLKTEDRHRILYRIGFAAIGLFLVLRGFNLYGDPEPWGTQADFTYTLMSFLDVEKYPPSLLFLLITLGPSLIVMVWFEKVRNRMTDIISVYGKVPFFYYILHLFLVHTLAIVIGLVQGYSADQFFFGFWAFPEGYGLGLPGVYLVWVAVVVLLYLPCKWYADLKKCSKSNLLTYL